MRKQSVSENIEETEVELPAVADVRSFVELVFLPLFIALVVVATACLYWITE